MTATLEASSRIVQRTNPVQRKPLQFGIKRVTRSKDGRLPGQAINGSGLAIATDFVAIFGNQTRRVFCARLGDTCQFWFDQNGQRQYVNAADLVLKPPIGEHELAKTLDK